VVDLGVVVVEDLNQSAQIDLAVLEEEEMVEEMIMETLLVDKLTLAAVEEDIDP
jgi:hypothetical protein